MGCALGLRVKLGWALAVFVEPAPDDPAKVTALEKRVKKLKLKFFRISAVTGEGVQELIEASWPIIAKAREREAKAIELAQQEEEEETPRPANYNPALVPPLRDSKKTAKKRR